MGRTGYNWKARRVPTTVIDDSSTKKIHIEFDSSNGNFDACNALVLPSKKRKTKIKHSQQQVKKILSKKQRKHLEKIVEKQKKKENRSSLLEALSAVQLPEDELKRLTSIASVQTKGLKKHFQEANCEPKQKHKFNAVAVEYKVNSLSGSKRRRILTSAAVNTDDVNVVGFDSSGSDVSDVESDEPIVDENVADDVIGDENAADDVIGDENAADDAIVGEQVAIVDEHVADVAIANKVADDATMKKSVNKKPVIVDLTERKPAVFVPVYRTTEMQNARLKLPILAEEQQIMETINDNPFVLLAGETGSGKTTQVPQFLYEAGYATNKMIGVTEPRRVAAISMSNRVAQEMNLTSEEISYLIRFEGNVTDKTKIKFMTDGVLLKEIQSDFLLTKYSVIILDEAHERSVYTDILVGLLTRIVPMRTKRKDPLKLVIMSATLRLEDFLENERLFKTKPAVVKVDARQFPVTVHFNKRTPDDYLREAYKKAVKIHTTLPDGGILIFVTGQLEVRQLVRRLRRAFPMKRGRQRDDAEQNESEEDEEERDLEKIAKARNKKRKTLPVIDLEDYALPGDEEAEDAGDESDVNDEDDAEFQMVSARQPLWTLPLYSLLPGREQSRVFSKPPDGCRLCVVSTNVAETSLTIPHVKYVVDTGKTKERLYDKVTGVTTYQVVWTSRASADQRAGRAGRTAPGHCYRLYSSAVFNDAFPAFAPPEIQRRPVDDLYLQMRCMNIQHVAKFPFVSAPDLLQLRGAERRLEVLGLLSGTQVTALGRAVSRFPVAPRFGKMLALSHQRGLLPYTVCLVAALSVPEVLLETPIVQIGSEEGRNLRKAWAATRRAWAGEGNSLMLGDPMVLLRAVGAAEYANVRGQLEKFCTENGLRNKAIVEIRKLRLQLTSHIQLNVADVDLCVDPNLKPPSDLQAKLLRQILLAGMGDQIARKVPPDEIKLDEDKIKFKYAYRTIDMEDPVFLHSSSVLKRSLPEFVIYQEVYETNKLYMRGVTAVQPDWLPVYVPHLCNLSEPLLDPEPRYDESDGGIHCFVTGTFGRQAWPLPTVEIQFPKSLDVYKWFAKYFLDGDIFKKLRKYKGSLLSTSNTMIKTWAKLQPRTEILLKALVAQDVTNKQRLVEIWEEQPKYLLHEYQKWLPESAYNEVDLIWPPLD